MKKGAVAYVGLKIMSKSMSGRILVSVFGAQQVWRCLNICATQQYKRMSGGLKSDRARSATVPFREISCRDEKEAESLNPKAKH